MKRYVFTIIFLSLMLLWAPQNADAQADPGRLVKSPSSSAVYYIGKDGKRHAFPNESIYKTWYTDFSEVEVITEAELASYQLGKNVLYRPGSRLIKIPSVPEVYAVEPFGHLRNLPSEQAAEKLYGENWTDKVDDVDVSFFFDYTVRGVVDVIDETLVFPRGTLIYHDGQQYLADKRTDGIHILRPVTESGFQLNDFNKLSVEIFTQGNKPSFYDEGAPLTFKEAAYSCVWCAPEDYARMSVKQTSAREGNELSVEVPDSWAVQFEDTGEEQTPQRLALAVEQQADDVDQFSDNLMIWRWDPADFGGDLKELASSTARLNDYVYYQGESLFLNNAIEVSAVKDNFIYHNHFFSKGGDFYQVQFTTSKQYAGRYTDVLDVALKQLQLP